MRLGSLATPCLLAILVLTLVVSNVVVEAASSTVMKGVVYRIEVRGFKTVEKGHKKYGAILIDLNVTFKLYNYNDTKFEVLLGTPFLKPSKYKGAVSPRLVSVAFIVDGRNITKSARLVTSGLTRVEIELSEPLGKRIAVVSVVVEGMVKSTSKLYVTKDYKLYKDYKPIAKRILYLDIVNFYQTITWCRDKVGGETVPGLRVIVESPPGWDIFYARSSITNKVRYMDIKRLVHHGSNAEVEFWYLSTSKVAPTDVPPGAIFSIEVGFQPISDYRNRVSMAIGALLIALALFLAYYYRDVWKYVTKAVG